jgi:trimeric autotransporter adhesin
MKKLFILLFLAIGFNIQAQVAVNTDGAPANPSAMLDVSSGIRGILIPRMTQAQRSAIGSPANGLLIYQTDNTPGFYYNSGTSGSPVWTKVGTGIGWSITGNSGTNSSNFIGTTDNGPLTFKVNNQLSGKMESATSNTSFGINTLLSNSTGNFNTAIGRNALSSIYNTNGNTAVGANALSDNSGEENTAVGQNALTTNIDGDWNTAAGTYALTSNVSGDYNTAVGHSALLNNTTGYQNTGIGTQALAFNTSAYLNTAIGYKALENQSFDPGTPFQTNNVAVGAYALNLNQPTGTSDGRRNTAIGNFALNFNSTGSNNTAGGYNALYNNTTGNANVAFGSRTLFNNTTRSNLVAIGDSALFNNGLNVTNDIEGSFNTAVGSKTLFANTTGHRNTAIGYHALKQNNTGWSNTAIGYIALANNTTACRNTAIGSYALSTQSFDPGFTWSSDNVAIGDLALLLNQPTSSGNGERNTAVGSSTMHDNTIGSNNVANGYAALFHNLTGNSNVAVGTQTLYYNTDRSNLVAVGDSALYHNGQNASGEFDATGNTAVGSKVLYSNTNGYGNSALGYQALYSNTSGYFNSSFGISAMDHNTSGRHNTAVGSYAMQLNTAGCNNIAIGYSALSSQSYNPGTTFSSDNIAIGRMSLFLNQPTSASNGIQNTAIGNSALYYNITGYSNTACGYNAAQTTTFGIQNTSLGAISLVNNQVGSYNTAIGYNTGPSASGFMNTTCLGIDASATGSDMVRIGNVYVGSIGGYQNWTNISDGRFKENVEENVPGLAFISQLRPVTYQLNRGQINEFIGVEARREGIRKDQPGVEFLGGDRYSPVTTGFIAQEVEQAAASCGFEFSGVDAPKNEKDLYGLRYAEFVVPLVKAVQEQQQQIEALKAENALLEARLAAIEIKLVEK